MIVDLPAIGTMTVSSQREAIALEQAIRRHVFASWETLDVFDQPNLAHPQLHRLEQRARDAEARQDWSGVEAGWAAWLAGVRARWPGVQRVIVCQRGR